LKIDDLLRLHPWEETLAALCAPVAESTTPAGDVARLIDQQRGSQLPTLERHMYGAQLEGDYSEDREDREGSPPRRQLRPPQQAARLFLASAAQAGALLRAAEPETVAALDPAARALGTLLALVAAAESSPAERREARARWDRLAASAVELTMSVGRALPFGAVLTPMVEAALRDGPGSAGQRLAEELADRRDESRRDDLTPWAGRFVRKGSSRLEWLSEGSFGRSGLKEDSEPEEEPRPDPPPSQGSRRNPFPFVITRLRIGGGRSAIERFLDELGTWPEVSRILRVEEPGPALLEVEVTASDDLRPDRVRRIAATVGVEVEILSSSPSSG
jgi:hypothetical protein